MRSAPEEAYVVWIIITTVGLLQALASYYDWPGLSYFRHDLRLGYPCAALLIAGSYFWFFSLADRNVPGLEGWQLFSRFGVGAVIGIVLAFVSSSIWNRDMHPAGRSGPPAETEVGFDALRYGTFLHLVRDLVQSACPALGRPGDVKQSE